MSGGAARAGGPGRLRPHVALSRDAPAGLVVAMHGYTQDVIDPASPNQAWGFKSTSQWATLAQQHEFYVIFPEKPALCRCEGGAYGCSTSCAALGKKESGGWTWPGNHAATLVTGAYPTVWKSATAKELCLLVFQGDADGAVTPENMADVVQQWKGATGITGAGTTSTRKGHDHTEYTMDGQTQLATILMHGIGHGTPVDPSAGADQGGWDPVPARPRAAMPTRSRTGRTRRPSGARTTRRSSSVSSPERPTPA